LLNEYVLFIAVTMNSREKWQLTLEEQEQERLRLRRREWHIERELERKHEERKLKKIEEYERKCQKRC